MNKTITIGGETREIEFRAAGETRLRSTTPAGLYQKRPGQKTWADWLTLWVQPDGSWRLATTSTILNRAGYRLVGWANKAATSQHNSALANQMKTMNNSITLEFTREELRTVFFACNKQIADLTTLADAKPTMEESLREEITSLFAIVERLSAASRF